jgi:hypothetical protein
MKRIMIPPDLLDYMISVLPGILRKGGLDGLDLIGITLLRLQKGTHIICGRRQVCDPDRQKYDVVFAEVISVPTHKCNCAMA